jgi:hypothetical protein
MEATMENKGTYAGGRAVYIVDGTRTPFLKAAGKAGPFAAADLAVGAGKALLARQSFAPAGLDEVIIGCIIPSPDEVNIARRGRAGKAAVFPAPLRIEAGKPLLMDQTVNAAAAGAAKYLRGAIDIFVDSGS